jgi:DNA-directed RNA polymerase subunit H (RpoH/RPB5)
MDIDIIINNIKEMLKERGDDIDEFDEHEVDIDRSEFYSDKNIIEFHTSATTIIFAMTKKLRKGIIEEIKDHNDNIMPFVEKYNNKLNIMLVFNNDNISVPLIQLLNKYDKLLQKKGGSIQYFHMKQLLYNPSKHSLVPKHTKLSPEESMEVMEKYMIKSKTQMPYISHNDVMAKRLGLKQGDIIKIDRYNENSGLSFGYRVCV